MSDPDRTERFTDQVLAMAKAFALCGARDEAQAIVDDVRLFVDVRSAILKIQNPDAGRGADFDLHTVNQHFTLKQTPLRRHHLDEFVDGYKTGRPRDERVESERWKSFTFDELIARDKANLDITWLRDESLEDTDNLPAPEVIAREIVEDLTAALAEFEAVAAALEAASSDPRRMTESAP